MATDLNKLLQETDIRTMKKDIRQLRGVGFIKQKEKINKPKIEEQIIKPTIGQPKFSSFENEPEQKATFAFNATDKAVYKGEEPQLSPIDRELSAPIKSDVIDEVVAKKEVEKRKSFMEEVEQWAQSSDKS